MNTSGSSEAGSASYLLPSVWLKVVAGKGFFLVLLAPLRSQGLYLQATQTGIKDIGQSVPTKTLDFGSKSLLSAIKHINDTGTTVSGAELSGSPQYFWTSQ